MAASKWTCIRRNYVFLSNKLYLSEGLLRLLYQECLISRGELEQLRNGRELTSSRLSHLLDILTRQDDSHFDTFCRCLRQVGQPHVADVLVASASQPTEQTARGLGETVNNCAPISRTAGSGGPGSGLPTLPSPIVTDEQIEAIKDVVAGDWVPFGRALLKLSADKVRDIVSPYSTEQLRASEKAYYVLDFWRQRDGRHATLETMLSACGKINKRGAAEHALSSDR